MELTCLKATVYYKCKQNPDRNATVYRMASNGSMFWFFKISNDSQVSSRIFVDEEGGYEQPLGLLVYLFRRAVVTSPTHSKQTSSQTYDAP
ncbi:uncharacterized protein N7518_002546 [Penicillium psychrosexuale]|uniref:uncharacterized protein n=1 Tax=Penicillium psychrosexuale TaxID=1002107 RepID=UPI0025455710|nr:uncharacterized protein N7518_002546 [Penicillium psychrosexuale]KAJ5800478.1 hypothetical protein N7518_002546 [Penicillium psychrosexuale]